MREALGRDAARRHPLQAIVANRCRCAKRFLGITRLELHVTRFEPPAVRRFVCPHTGEAVGLKLERDRCASCAGTGILLNPPHHAIQVLNVMTEFMRNDVGLRKIAGRAEPLRQLGEESEVEIHLDRRGQ